MLLWALHAETEKKNLNLRVMLLVQTGSDSVTRVNDSTLLESRYWWLGLNSSDVEKNGDSTRVTFFTEWLDSSHSHWLESQSLTRVRVIFTKSLSSWWTNPVRLRTKKWGFLA